MSQVLVAYERPPLPELLATGSLGVFADMWETMVVDWQRISAVDRSSPVAGAALQQAPSVWKVFGQPIGFVQALPQRCCGGLDLAEVERRVACDAVQPGAETASLGSS